jgi:hypothetical protein
MSSGQPKPRSYRKSPGAAMHTGVGAVPDGGPVHARQAAPRFVSHEL